MQASGRRSRVASGTVARGFEAVARAFESNFADSQEVGAAFSAVVDGRTVIDLWGGSADPDRGSAWTSETLQTIFSGTKGLVAVCILMLVERGRIDLDAPVCRYWPEFAAEGKENVRVVDVTTHSARLPAILAPLDEDDLTDARKIADLLAAQPCDNDPRAENAYHALTYGWLCGEIVRRVDGRSIGQYFQDEIAEPLGLRIWLGLPVELESRVSVTSYGPNWSARRCREAELRSDELLTRIWANPPLFPADRLPWNRPDWHEAEIPGAGAVASAASVARLYGCLASGGEIDGIRILSPATIALGTQEVVRRFEPFLEEEQVFGIGFQLQTDRNVFGPPKDAFGHGGAGGSVHGAWPSLGVGFSYAMNSMRDDSEVDPRSRLLLEALHSCLS